MIVQYKEGQSSDKDVNKTHFLQFENWSFSPNDFKSDVGTLGPKNHTQSVYSNKFLTPTMVKTVNLIL